MFWPVYKMYSKKKTSIRPIFMFNILFSEVVLTVK